MEDNILKSTKTMLGIDENQTVFDLEVTTHINSAFSHLHQLGIGTGAYLEDDQVNWSDLSLPQNQLNMVKTFIFLKVKFGFDPPGTSYLLDAAEKQIREQEWRLCEYVEVDFG